MDPRPYVNKADAKRLKAKGKVEGKDFVVPKHCIGQTHHLCIVCLRIIRRRDQRCRPRDYHGRATQMIRFKLGDRVRKIKGSSWQGYVRGEYSTTLTPHGVCVESEHEPGSVQVYPEDALEAVITGERND